MNFGKNARIYEPISIKGIEVERVSVYKYLGVVIDDGLSWGDHIDCIVKSSDVLSPENGFLSSQDRDPRDVSLYVGYVDIVLFAGVEMCLNRLKSVDSVYQSLLGRELDHVWNDEFHQLHGRYSGQRSFRGSCRLRLPPLITNRYRGSSILMH